MDSNRRRLLIAAGAGVAIAARGHHAVAATPHVITIDGFEYKPAALTVKKDEVVEWRNSDPVPHTATARGAFDSGEITPGKAWRLTASAKGRFDYVCSFHPTMKGTLIVS
jgi:plastocyanin